MSRIQELINTDGRAQEWYHNLHSTAEEIGQTDLTGSDSDSVSFQKAEQILDRVRKFAFLWLITGERSYKERAIDTLAAVVELPDWNPKHFLNTVTLATAVALGYNWLGKAIPNRQRRRFRRALLEMCIVPALLAYRRGAWWTKQRNNWGLVTNSGVCLAVLAVILADSTSTERLEKAYAQGIRRVEETCERFGSEGSWPEGPGYWRYGTKFLVYLLSSIRNIGGTELSLPDGVSETGAYPLGLTGPTRPFNVGDSVVSSLVDAPALFWLSERYGSPAWAGYQAAASGQSEGIEQNLFWYEPDNMPDTDAFLDRFNHFRDVSIVTFRNGQTLDADSFLGFKTDNTNSAHGDLDGGTFVFASDGVQWAVELGRDDYDLPGYWDTDSARWDYYRKRAEGHNTLVFKSDESPDQAPNGDGTLERVVTGPGGGFAVADLTALYPLVQDTRRGIAFLDEGASLLIQDEVTVAEANHMWWFLHTRTDLHVHDRVARFEHDDQDLTAHVISPSNTRFQSWRAIPLSDAPDPPGQAPNNGVTKLAISRDITDSVRLTVWLTTNDTDPPTVGHLSEWNEYSFEDRI